MGWQSSITSSSSLGITKKYLIIHQVLKTAGHRDLPISVYSVSHLSGGGSSPGFIALAKENLGWFFLGIQISDDGFLSLSLSVNLSYSLSLPLFLSLFLSLTLSLSFSFSLYLSQAHKLS